MGNRWARKATVKTNRLSLREPGLPESVQVLSGSRQTSLSRKSGTMTKTIAIIAEKGARVFHWSATRDAIATHGTRLVWFTECPENTLPRRWRVLPARAMWRFVQMMENRSAGATFHYYNPEKTIDLPCRFKGHFKDFDDAAVARIRDSGADLLIRLGGRGIYRGAILSATPAGMVSIHHGDNRVYRGGPPGFWEVMNDEAKCGYVVQRLNHSLDGGEVLARGFVTTQPLATQNRENLYAAADQALAGVVGHFLETGSLPEAEPPVKSLGKIYRLPGLLHLAAYLWRAWMPASLRPGPARRGAG